MNELPVVESDEPEFVELDPTGRYGRYNEVLGKGASKTVYRAFDEYEGIEVAWNQVKLHDFLQSPEDLERLYCEIHLLKTLKHNNIMKFYSSWVDTDNRNINFVTEMFTSGTLKQYRHKHKRVHNRALKHWCRQILNGLVYLHSHDPPIIHRDLKCDNIFINGNQGEVKIGDLGLAAILRNSHAARCVGTPEFMAPEVYQEEYNELVDIYAFGMCTLEMVTFEYPYSECFHPAQIYKKVISGKKPDALYKVTDPEVRRFIDKCLATVSCRLPARELLKDPFLQIDDYESSLQPLDYCRDFDGIGPMLRQPSFKVNDGCDSLINGYSSYVDHEPGLGMDCILPDFESNEIDLLKNQEDELFKNVDITIKGRREDDGIFLRLRMADKEGRIRNIYFPFDLENDTARSVAAEMVEELDISDQEVTKIADMINGEIVSLVPEWNKKLGQEESPDHTDKLDDGYCQTCGANGSKVDSLSTSNPCAMNLQVLHCSSHGCAPTRGRFEEITYQLGASEQCASAGAPAISSQSDGMQQSDSGNAELGESCLGNKEKVISVYNGHSSVSRESHMKDASPALDLSEDYYENEIRQELRWLKAKYQMQLRKLRDQQLGVISRNTSFSNNNYDKKNNLSSGSSSFKIGDKKNLNLCYSEKNHANQRSKNDDAAFGDYSPEHMVTAKSFYTGDLLPQYLHRATSLPVDAVDIN